MGGTKRKIKIEKIQNKTVKSVAFTKRRIGLFRKASELCLLSPGTQIAILATPPSSNSHASFYSFGHSSVDHVVSSLLNDQVPLPVRNLENNSGLGYWWWEDEAFDRCENVNDLNKAAEAITRMLNNLRVRADALDSNNQRVVEDMETNQTAEVAEEEEEVQFQNTMANNKEETMNQITIFEGTSSASASANLVEMKNNGEETKNQITNFEGTSGSANLVEMKNNREEAMNRIVKFEGTSSGSANLEETDEDLLLFMANGLADVNFDFDKTFFN